MYLIHCKTNKQKDTFTDIHVHVKGKKTPLQYRK